MMCCQKDIENVVLYEDWTVDDKAEPVAKFNRDTLSTACVSLWHG